MISLVKVSEQLYVNPVSVACVYVPPAAWDAPKTVGEIGFCSLVLKSGAVYFVEKPLSEVLRLLGFEQSPHIADGAGFGCSLRQQKHTFEFNPQHEHLDCCKWCGEPRSYWAHA